MKFKLEILMDNAAFDEAPGEELARILETVAANLRGEAGEYLLNPVAKRYGASALFDVNGNRNGKWEIEP